MDRAAKHGNLAVVRFLHEHRNEGCTTDAIDDAAEKGHAEVIRFLIENRHEGCTEYASYWAAHNGHLECVKLIHEHFHHFCNNHILQAAERGRYAVVEYLSANCDSSTGAALTYAARAGHLKVVQLLVATRNDVCYYSAWAWARLNNHTKVAAFLKPLTNTKKYCDDDYHQRSDFKAWCKKELGDTTHKQ